MISKATWRRAGATVALVVLLLAALPVQAEASKAFAYETDMPCASAVRVTMVTGRGAGWPLMTGRSAFDPVLTLAGILEPGSLGLPGEPVTWVIGVANRGAVAGTDVVITDTLADHLRVDRAVTTHGQAVISGQVVVVTIPVLNPGENVEITIATTVLYGPANGVLVNQVLLAANGPGGAITKNAVAEVFVPTGLPATGYPPTDDLPGVGEPSVLQVGLAALGTVVLTALIVWHRGRRQ